METARIIKEAEFLSRLLRIHAGVFEAARQRADRIGFLFEEISACIERHTEVVCPDCKKVCCINRHSYYTYEDLVCISAAGEQAPPIIAGIDDAAPCQFLGAGGCRLRRFLRPYRCTWFFCTPLLEHIQTMPVRQYRTFISQLESLTKQREELLREFEAATVVSGEDLSALKSISRDHALMTSPGIKPL